MGKKTDSPNVASDVASDVALSLAEAADPLNEPANIADAPSFDELPNLDDAPSLVIITGMSGAGRTVAMHILEDLGYFCIDNLPPSLLIDLVSLASLPSSGERRLAVVCDLRAKEFFSALNGELIHLQDRGIPYTIIFLDANEETLLNRFKESRRRHPLCEDAMTIAEGIAAEREMLASVRETANYVIDTSKKEARELRREIHGIFSQKSEQDELHVAVFSFGFKYSSPYEADIVIDVRFLPNPYYELALRKKTGLDDEVRDFVLDREETQEFLQSWRSLLKVIMPGYVAEGKRYLSIGIGCTGGQHRSVALAEETSAFLGELGYQVAVTHRDLPLAETLEELAITDDEPGDK
ncbi:MAG: RNase adapter RapZ [Coriobacteriales bacterium]|nr:RNase adapter RapZ [Coriobacteriales bacterium]